ncbi:MAG: thrombospondin type 3 repeat-containing protein [Candidatus Aenigmatarchaeota archaeon]
MEKSGKMKFQWVTYHEKIAIIAIIIVIILALLLALFGFNTGIFPGNFTLNNTNQTDRLAPGNTTTTLGLNASTITTTTSSGGGGGTSSVATSTIDPDMDSDGDGFPDAEEIEQGTDPNDPNDFPVCHKPTDCWSFCYDAGYLNGGRGPVESPGNCNMNEIYASGCCCNMTSTSTSSSSTTTSTSKTTSTIYDAGGTAYSCCNLKSTYSCVTGTRCPVLYRKLGGYDSLKQCEQYCKLSKTTITTSASTTSVTTSVTTTVAPSCSDTDINVSGLDSFKTPGYCLANTGMKLLDSCLPDGSLSEAICGADGVCTAAVIWCSDWFPGGYCSNNACIARTCDILAVEKGYQRGAWQNLWENYAGTSNYQKCGNYAVLQCTNQNKVVKRWNTGCAFGNCCVWDCQDPTTTTSSTSTTSVTTTSIPDCTTMANQQYDIVHGVYGYYNYQNCVSYANSQCVPYPQNYVYDNEMADGCCMWTCRSEVEQGCTLKCNPPYTGGAYGATAMVMGSCQAYSEYACGRSVPFSFFDDENCCCYSC